MIEIRDNGPVRTLRLSRPEKRNALHPQLISEMTEAVEQLPPNIRVLLITGTGKAFCAGADLAYLHKLSEFSYEENVKDSAALMRLYRAIYETPSIVISRVNGHALGGGMGFLLVADFVLAVEHAKLGFPEVKIGFVPALVSVFLQRKVGGGVARELLLSGRTFSPSEAGRWGLVTKSFDNLQVLDTYLESFIANILAHTSPQSIASTKKLLRRVDGMSLDEALEQAVLSNAEARRNHDFKVGLASFLQKKVIRWD